MSVRNTAPTKNLGLRGLKDLTLIILSVSSGRRSSSYGNKSLLTVDNTNLINYQIKTIKSRFPDLYDVVIVGGFEFDKMIKTLSPYIRCVENENYEHNNTSRSISLGLKCSSSDNILIVYGDIFFDQYTLDNFVEKSGVLTESSGKMSSNKIGATINFDNHIENFAFNLPKKFGGLFFLTGKELELMRKFTYVRENDNLCTFELFNKVIDKGGTLKNFSLPDKSELFEFNSINDILKFKKENQ